MALVDDIKRLGLAAERGEMSPPEATRQLLEVARLSPDSAAEMIRDWRTAVERYKEVGRLTVKATAEGARLAAQAPPRE